MIIFELMHRLIEAGLGLVHIARDFKRGFTDADIAEVRQILAGQINKGHIISYERRRAQLFSGFHASPMRTFFSESLSLVTPADIYGEIEEIRRIQNLKPAELIEELLQDARARAIRYGLITN